MATYTATDALAPAIIPNRAGELVGDDKTFDMASLNGVALGADDIIRLIKLPADCIVVDALIDTDSAIAGLAVDVGILNAAGDDTGAELFAAQSIATEGTVRTSEAGWPRTANRTSGDLWIAAKVTGASSATSGRATLHLVYRNVT